MVGAVASYCGCVVQVRSMSVEEAAERWAGGVKLYAELGYASK
jgi:hypothetical protein